MTAPNCLSGSFDAARGRRASQGNLLRGTLVGLVLVAPIWIATIAVASHLFA